MAAVPRHIKTALSLTRAETKKVIGIALEMKSNPDAFRDALQHRTILSLFEKPSLRTRVSLETGMTQMGGHTIAYMIENSPLGKKESAEDTGAVVSRMVDGVTARVNCRTQVDALAADELNISQNLFCEALRFAGGSKISKSGGLFQISFVQASISIAILG